ncbi:adenylate/guanylate cyclase domain-containing protein [Lysobacter sp. D1-1-M9]|uniref:adenylate/guanylate cyclase domain-containing protein n=1 Tax=Novilysobacter longmucuonensis TaxID=3098603 RepID=UPI002FCA3BAC
MYVKNLHPTLTEGRSAVAGRSVNVVALFCDLRGFSDWCERVDINQVEALMRAQFEQVLQICNDHHHDFHKFLGDGFVLVWEESDEVSLHTCLARALDAAFTLHKKYWYFSQKEMTDVPLGVRHRDRLWRGGAAAAGNVPGRAQRDRLRGLSAQLRRTLANPGRRLRRRAQRLGG